MKRKARLATFVRAARGTLGLSQRELAAKLLVSHTYISKIETQHIEIMPSAKLLCNLADILGISHKQAMNAVGMVDLSKLDTILEKYPDTAMMINEILESEE